jgi:hypothetical protein
VTLPLSPKEIKLCEILADLVLTIGDLRQLLRRVQEQSVENSAGDYIIPTDLYIEIEEALQK